MTANEIADKAIEMMREYLRAVEKNGLDSVNMTIGKRVKTSYKLVNLNDREDNPSCTLIQSHQIFE
jgi:predicted ATP-grasp superfamily ATP-dependent carboligase